MRFSLPGPDTVITALTAGAGGFTAAGLVGQAGRQAVVTWTSTAGTGWTSALAGGLGGSGSQEITALASSGPAVTGVGAAATMQGQQILILALPPR